MNDSEKQMAEGIRRGDNRAMRDFYATFGPQLTAVCSRYIAADDDVKDVIQESLLSIISNINTFEYHEKGSLRAWSTRIVINHALGFLRKKKKETQIFADSGTIPDDTAFDSTSADPPDIHDIPADVITDMIRRLPDGYRAVFNLYVIEEKSHKEIAGLLGIKEDSSASQLHRAKALLAKQIKEYKSKSRQRI
ncbi:MAG: RNA polymerase sigma factor [Prevotella sp.]|nr:RNA polymerase sigma factor [Prevotella sp.]